MNDKLNVVFQNSVVGTIVRNEAETVFNYDSNCEPDDFVSLTMPVRDKSYVNRELHPIFEMHLPEGYLLSIIKKHFSKITATDDFGLLNLLSASIRGRVQYESQALPAFTPLHLEDVLHPTSSRLFDELVTRFALNSPLSGVQPKVLARIEDKATLKLEDYIIKAWGEDYPQLALNEYYCMLAVKEAGILVPEFYLSDDDQLFIIKRFDIKEDGSYLGFEDMCVLQAKQRDDKYKGSYEKVAKSVALFSSNHLRLKSLVQLFKMIVMNNLLQNGDAHLKNFGVYYSDMNEIQMAPAYDIVSTTAYIQNDIPALTLFGSKRWHAKDKLIEFGITSCGLSNKQALGFYSECLQGMSLLLNQVNHRLEAESQPDKIDLLVHLQNLAMKALNQS
jgi:serine/threonine-protein kinase HipA